MRAIFMETMSEKLNAIPLEVWSSFHQMYLDDQVESYGHHGFATLDSEQYRSNMAVVSREEEKAHWLLVADDKDELSTDESWDSVDAGDVVGFMTLEMPLNDNLDLAYPSLYIDPAHRRKGYGTAAIGFMRDYGLARGRVKQEAWTKVPREASGDVLRPRNGSGAVPADHYVVAFMVSLGFGLDMIEKSSSINLSEQRERLVSLAETAPEDYTFEVYRGLGDPEETAYMWTAFSEDVPRSESTEPEVFTAERVMNMMADQHAKQWDDTTGVIRYQGKPVGYSSVSFKLGGRVGYQEGTWVDRVHRGKGLSLHAKVANYLMILEEDILDEIQTENAEDNRAMWAVNEKLGFQISSSEGDWTCRYDNGVWGPI